MLDVGVTSDERFREPNYFEQMYPFPTADLAAGQVGGTLKQYDFVNVVTSRPSTLPG